MSTAKPSPSPAGPAAHAEPLAATLRRTDTELRFTLLSRGDRISGRLVAPAQPLGLVLFLASDGKAWGSAADAAIAAWSPRIAVAAIDLPICGTRASDKIDLDRVLSGDRTGALLRSDIEAQLASDLQRTCALLRAEGPHLAAARTGLVALGAAADLVAPHSPLAEGLCVIALGSPRARVPAKTTAGPCEILALDPPSDPLETDWLARTGALLERALR
jgi:hypothetical protein